MAKIKLIGIYLANDVLIKKSTLDFTFSFRQILAVINSELHLDKEKQTLFSITPM